MVKNVKKSCPGPIIVGKILALAGMYILTWGLVGSNAWDVVLKSPIFWGLFLLGAAGCAMRVGHMEACKK